MFQDNKRPRYLPHLQRPEVLHMGLTPLGDSSWIEPDRDLGSFYRHKLAQRARYGDRVYRATTDSLPAQRELSERLLEHLRTAHAAHFRLGDGQLHCDFADIHTPLTSDEPLWNCSLWVADDLVIMERGRDGYRLTAASLCSASHWRLEDKFDRPMALVHDPIPDFRQQLTPRIDRFFEHLKSEHPVVRYNWALQEGDSLNERLEEAKKVDSGSSLYYRCERQSLVRLPQTGAIAFTIRVYLHPLETLAAIEGALPALFEAIDNTPPQLAAYKGFDRLEIALARYRGVRDT